MEPSFDGLPEFSGNDLLNKFRELDIYNGKLNVNVFDSWFDGSKGMKSVLSWICTYFSSDNVLSFNEKECYKQIVQSNRLLTDLEFDNTLARLHTDYPGINRPDEIAFDISCLEDEVELAMHEKHHKELQLKLEEKKEKKISKILYELAEEQCCSNDILEKEAEKCLQLSRRLDSLNIKLAEQVERYSHQLNNYENVEHPLFLSFCSLDEYNDDHKRILSYLEMFSRKNCSFVKPDANSTITLKTNSSDAPFRFNIEESSKRCYHDLLNKCMAELKERKYSSKIDFINNINVKALPNLNSADFRSEYNGKTNVLNKLKNELKSVLQKKVDDRLCEWKLQVMEKENKQKEEKLELLNAVNNKLTDILSVDLVLSLLVAQETSDIEFTNQFFKSVLIYIATNIRTAKSQTETIQKLMQECDGIKSQPIEKRYQIIEDVKTMLGFKEDVSLPFIIEKFKNKKIRLTELENYLFHENCIQHREKCREMEVYNETLSHHLQDGLTKQLIVMPNKLSEAVANVNDEMRKKEDLVGQVMNISNEVERQVKGNVQGQTERRLWMKALANRKLPKDC